MSRFPSLGSRAFRICLTLLAAARIAAAADAPSGKTTLRYRFDADAALHYTIGNQSRINVQVGTTAESVTHSSESGRVLRPIAVNADGSAVLEVLIEYVNLTAGEDIRWDSRSGTPAPGEFAGIEETIGRPLMKITVASSGEITGAESNGKVADKHQLDATQFDLFPVLPAGPVAVGDTWTEPFQVDIISAANLPKKIALQRTYTLKTIANGIAEIDIQTSVLTPVDDPLEEAQLIQRTPGGSARFDIAHGRLLERVMSLDNKVVGFKGPQSVLSVMNTRQESLGSSETTAAGKGARITK